MRRLLLLALLPFAARAEIKDRIAAVVNGQPVTLSEVEERVGPELNRLGAPSPGNSVQRKELLKRGLSQLVDEKLVDSEAGAIGFDVSEEEIRNGIEQLARQNNMDAAQFKEAIAAQGLDFDVIRESIRRQQLMVKLLQYKVKPRKVSDEEVQSAYAAVAAEGEPEVRARHLYIASPDGAPAKLQQAAKEKADQALRRLRAGETFAKVARDLSEGPGAAEGGDLGYFRRGQMLPAIENAAFSLKPGELSGLIRTPGEHGGYHLVQVEDRRKIAAKPLAEMQEELRNRIASESIFKERQHYLEQLRKTAQIDEKM